MLSEGFLLSGMVRSAMAAIMDGHNDCVTSTTVGVKLNVSRAGARLHIHCDGTKSMTMTA